MTIWTPITIESISCYLSPIQLSALQKHGEPLETIIADIVAWVRAEVHSNPHNEIIKNASFIPLELKAATCHLIIEAFQSRIPSLKLSEDQIRNAKNARALLKRVACAEVAITPLTNINQVTVLHSRPSIFSNHHD